MKLVISVIICLLFLGLLYQNNNIEKNSYSVDIGSISDFQDLNIYNFENFDNNVNQQTESIFYKRVTSNDELTLFIDTLISENDFINIENKLALFDTNYFEENALIIILLNTSTTGYHYDCKNIIIEDDSAVVTLKVSGEGSGEAEQNTFVFIETKQFSDNLSIKISLLYD